MTAADVNGFYGRRSRILKAELPFLSPGFSL
jgi:hypothetical protein